MWKYSAKYCQSHITQLWIWIILWSCWVKITLINRQVCVFRLLSFSIMESHALLVCLYHTNMTSFACSYFMTADLLNLRLTDITTSLDTQVSTMFDKMVAIIIIFEVTLQIDIGIWDPRIPHLHLKLATILASLCLRPNFCISSKGFHKIYIGIM